MGAVVVLLGGQVCDLRRLLGLRLVLTRGRGLMEGTVLVLSVLAV